MENNRWDDQGNYHDDDVRLNNYTESADIKLERTDIAQADFNLHIKPEFVEKVVQSVQMELGVELRRNPAISTEEIKMQARYRFNDLLERQLLNQREAERCYQRFVHLLHYYYGS